MEERVPLQASESQERTSVDLGEVKYLKENVKNSTTRTGQSSRYSLEEGYPVTDKTEDITLSWRDINAFAVLPSRACCRGPDPTVVPKHILRSVTGHVKSGTLLAILGASGAGKSTLLNVLASRNQGQLKVDGEIRVNGVDAGRNIRNISAYVQQDDLFIGTLTVREHLEFRALLRMDKRLRKQDRLQKVDDVMDELGLTECAHTNIGTVGGNQGISGGERKRLSIATEMLTNPPLIFCDEPTSGLDTFMAANIVQSLKLMASKGRTILCTIHQPSSEVFDMFDQIAILSEGRTAFMGHSFDALTFYDKLKYPCPTNYNPADHYIMTMAIVPGSVEESKHRVETICDAFTNSTYAANILEDIDKLIEKTATEHRVLIKDPLKDSSMYSSGWVQQFCSLMWRGFVSSVRNPMVLRVKFIQTIVMALLVGMIFLKSEDRSQYTLNDVQNINGLFFIILVQQGFNFVFGIITIFPMEMPIFLREYGSGIYRVDVYYLSKILTELPLMFIFPFMYAAIVYFMADLYSDAAAFFYFSGVMIILANISASLGYVISIVAGTVAVSTAVAPVIFIPWVIFSGFLVNNKSVPYWFIWAKYLSFIQWTFQLLSVNQWTKVDQIYCSTENAQNGTRDVCSNGQEVLDVFDFSSENQTMAFCVLVAIWIGLKLIAFLILLLKAKRSRT